MKKIVFFFIGLFIFLVVVSLALTLMGKRIPIGEKIALIKVEGVILSSKDTIKELKKYREDPSIKAIVLSVDSPGGAVVPSQEIYEEVKKTNARKKVVVSMGSVAASGGYYISAPATKIMANSATVTGSIGAYMETVNISDLMDKLGIKREVVKSAKYKDMGSLYHGLGPEERAMFQGLLDDIHHQFVEAVASGRKMPIEKAEALADGRIFTGRQALKAGLVDKIGTLQDTIKETALLVGIKGEPNVVTKKEEFIVSDLFSGKLITEIILKLFPLYKFNYLMVN
ncbi:signal peptide peptidase SppA [Candidatus Magnetominusculus xianensis]|uniref:Multidrug transporter n=1 Tax=Candidatus Magnetominusculus xianensis TaxID=1748249 RepID=A0ABR5SG09_9BACT|nr:signal peptide peptidase SppA [Candidatus Magnetominusculus xianensis]KWT87240.1 multidrug transporter [Candidatus Magnetominusculus xianensis]MBF0405061.1 signal peptide peptidase SppA [Nitrospirota bacterium]